MEIESKECMIRKSVVANQGTGMSPANTSLGLKTLVLRGTPWMGARVKVEDSKSMTEAERVDEGMCKPAPHPPGFEFQKELCALINAHGIDNQLSVPDSILANYVWDCLNGLTNLKVGLLHYKINEIERGRQ